MNFLLPFLYTTILIYSISNAFSFESTEKKLIQFQDLQEKFPLAKKELEKLNHTLTELNLSPTDIKKLKDIFFSLDEKSVQIYSKQINDIHEMPVAFKSKDYLLSNLDPNILGKNDLKYLFELIDSNEQLSENELINQIIKSCR